ncbi:tautomerase family protein [Kitasatospora sp. NPDC093558]|uniref:tautomerase family protein n=1 Tax=Kitasatospora sp. NPDC093558 TaxID=3155201 RepID=UPI003435DF0B
MPHVNIKHFPRDVTPQQKRDLADAITTVIAEHFDVPACAVSIALEPVPETSWNDTVVGPEISGRKHLVVKEPDYRREHPAR